MGILSKSLKARLALRRRVKEMDMTFVADMVSRPLYTLDPFETQFEAIEEAKYYKSRRRRLIRHSKQTLSVMTWNIKFGGGRLDFWFDGHGTRVVMRDWEVLANLEGVAAKIRQFNPDILLLQEVDVDSKRVAYIDQMQWLLDRTQLNFGAYASQWRSKFVPSNGLGRVDMGVAILSKYPIDDAQRLALPEMTTQDRMTRYFYLKRGILTAKIDVPGFGPVHAVNIHTAAFSKDETKKRHIQWFKGELERIDSAGGVFVAGGDLNAIPPGTKKQYDFSDVVSEDVNFQGSDYREETEWLQPLYSSFEPAVELAAYQKDNEPYFSHSTSGRKFWNRKLDYLFTNRSFVDGSVMTHQDMASGGMKTMLLSDHAPVTASLDLRKH